MKAVKGYVLTFGAAVFLVSCGTSKPVTYNNRSVSKNVVKTNSERELDSKFSGSINKEIRNLLKDAEKYLGVPYKFGGNTPSGFDCSGFTVKVFEENDYILPRRSADQATVGDPVNINEVRPGDLLFFATAGNGRVSHVGIVHDIGNDGEIKFIHASTSKGVIISSLSEKYWNKAYMRAQRIF